MAVKRTWLLQNTEDPTLFGVGTMDVVFDSGGRLTHLEGVEKLQFLLLKCILTGRYIENTISYGSTIPRLVGVRMRASNAMMDGMFLMAVDRAIQSFKNAQPYDLAASEKMARVDGEIQVTRDPRDRTILLIGAAVRNDEGRLIPIIHSFKTV